MIPPEVLERHNRARELTGQHFDATRDAVEQDGSTPIGNTGRRLPIAWPE